MLTFTANVYGCGCGRSAKAFIALHAAMLEKSVYALARFVRTAGAAPRCGRARPPTPLSHILFFALKKLLCLVLMSGL